MLARGSMILQMVRAVQVTIGGCPLFAPASVMEGDGDFCDSRDRP